MRSAGLLPYRIRGELEVLIAHPGGPWFAHKDEGSWSLVKGIVERNEDVAQAAIREFEEETGWDAPLGGWVSLGETKLRSGKRVVAWAVERDFDPMLLNPGTFEMNGRRYPEIDRVDWFGPDRARQKLNRAQGVFVDRLQEHLRLNGP